MYVKYPQRMLEISWFSPVWKSRAWNSHYQTVNVSKTYRRFATKYSFAIWSSYAWLGYSWLVQSNSIENISCWVLHRWILIIILYLWTELGNFLLSLNKNCEEKRYNTHFHSTRYWPLLISTTTEEHTLEIYSKSKALFCKSWINILP